MEIISFEEINSLSKISTANNLQVYASIDLNDGNYNDSVDTFLQIKGHLESKNEKDNIFSKNTFILESKETTGESGRYTFIGYNPKIAYTYQNGIIHEVTKESSTRTQIDNPTTFLDNIVSKYKVDKNPDLPYFTGGLVGYFSFEYCGCFEEKIKSASSKNGENDTPDFDLMLFDKIIAFDNQENKCYFIATIPNIQDTQDLRLVYLEARDSLNDMSEFLSSKKQYNFDKLHITSDWELKFSKDEFIDIVNTAKQYIYDGDIFQVVLANQKKAKCEGSLFEIYSHLRDSNPSPYMFYFSSPNMELAGSSPETLVKLDNGKLTTYPLAGTRPRGKNAAEDRALEKDLLADEKEISEHNMLVDLGRNDIGKISKFGTVNVEEYKKIVRYSHVMHISSKVTGDINDSNSPLKSVEAILPAGTLSGAPKVRAIEIINELEGEPRGIYGGGVAAIGFTGDVNTCISIRLAFKHNGEIKIRSGAGIVADSDPEKEYEETINKMKAVTIAVEDVSL
ncbi:MAG: chorismate-binding protein [Bifidobacteriaceae bacterium]|jgi:anthranilate synthase component 1|nr:chorismate-binding protein [Bifidobacteriaceae bacterium]